MIRQARQESTGSPRKRRLTARTVCALLVLLVLVPQAIAQDGGALTADPAARRSEYETMLNEIKLSSARTERLAAEIAAVKKDSVSITNALIQAAKTEKKLSEDIEKINDRLETLKIQADMLHGSLLARRDVLAEVLGALQRMGLNPPPAIVVEPDDALSSVRSAILLGAVVPELRQETEKLMADMKEMNRLTDSISTERERLTASVENQVLEKQRLSMLLEARQKARTQTEADLQMEKNRSEELAARAGNLKDLIESLDKQAAATRAEAETARLAREQELRRENELAALPENNAQVVSLPFSTLEGKLALPVAGRFKLHYGNKDDNGGVMQGDTVATQSGAIVTSPADGTILYAGPFRSYGQLLILDAGEGYHIVLAGMSNISVAIGQSVLAGEPIGATGDARVASAQANNVANGPELYIEFRKDGKPVDPSPWWAERLSGRTGNDA